MSFERIQRIKSFRRVSGLLLWFSTPLLVLTCLGGFLGLLGIVFVKAGDITIMTCLTKLLDAPDNWGDFLRAGPKLETRLFLIFGLLLIFAPAIYILTQFQGLIACFYNGDIFNTEALKRARNGYSAYLYTTIAAIVFHLIAIAIVAVNSANGTDTRIWNWVHETLSSLIHLGFLSLVLWAMEIGTDLNAEVELTI